MGKTIREILERHEGRRRRPYKCSAGANTIGVGHNIDANPLPADIAKHLRETGSIDNEMIDRLLAMDINRARSDCKKLFPEFDKFSPNRQMALIDFLFQLGLTRASKFINTIAAINTGRWEDVAEGIRKSKYWKQLGGDPEGTDDGKQERPETIADLIEVG